LFGCALSLTTLGAASAKSPDDEITAWLSVRGVSASGKAVDGSEDADKSGGVFGASLAWDHVAGPNQFGLDTSSTYYAYSDKGRHDRWSNRIAATYERDLSEELSVALRGDFTSNLASLESSSVDQKQVRATMNFKQGSSRVRLFGGWRWRDYRDGTSGDGEIVAADYRYRLAKSGSLRVGAQYDAIAADVKRRNYHRHTIDGEFTFSPLEDMSASVGLRYRRWVYQDRFVGIQRQKDHSISPTVGLSYALSRDLFLDLEGEYIRRRSNDAQFDDNIRRVTVGIRKRLRLLN
jgi:opacity protein-like surface antigen